MCDVNVGVKVCDVGCVKGGMMDVWDGGERAGRRGARARVFEEE